jgi:glucose uptake protein GlcU
MVNFIDMSLGMVIGMVLSPLIMKISKKILSRYRFNKIIKEFIDSKKNDDNTNSQ